MTPLLQIRHREAVSTLFESPLFIRPSESLFKITSLVSVNETIVPIRHIHPRAFDWVSLMNTPSLRSADSNLQEPTSY